MTVLTTDRLVVRRFEPADAAFILELVNDEAWLRFIGDRGVRTLEDARNYIERGPLAMYERFGFGLYLVATRDPLTPVGMCGLLKRDTLPDVDVGFAFLPAYRGRGYAGESARGVLRLAHEQFGVTRITALARPENASSIRVLEKLGFSYERLVRLPGATADSGIYALTLGAGKSATPGAPGAGAPPP